MNKKVVIIIVVIFLIAVIGAVIYYFTMPSSDNSPCSKYKETDFNISRECIIHMWNNIAGCPNTPSDIIDYYAQTTKPVGAATVSINGTSVASANRTLGAMKADAKEWARLSDTAHRTKCYGSDTSKWPVA